MQLLTHDPKSWQLRRATEILACTSLEHSNANAAVGGGLHSEILRMAVPGGAASRYRRRLALHAPARLDAHSLRVKLPDTGGALILAKLQVQFDDHSACVAIAAVRCTDARAWVPTSSSAGVGSGLIPVANAPLV